MRRHCCSRCTHAASLCATCISLTHWLASAANSAHSINPWSYVSAIYLIRCSLFGTAVQVRGRTHGCLSACHDSLGTAVLPFQDQHMTGTATTVRLLSPRRLVNSSFTGLTRLLIAPAENTYYSRVSHKPCIELSVSW